MAGFGALLLWLGVLYVVVLAGEVVGRLVLFYVRNVAPEWWPFVAPAVWSAVPLTVEIGAWLALWSVSSWAAVGLAVVVGVCVTRDRVRCSWWGAPSVGVDGSRMWTEDDLR